MTVISLVLFRELLPAIAYLSEVWQNAEHTCMTQRGIRALGAVTVTSALLGALRTDPRSRAEFFALAGVPTAPEPVR
jgi:GTP cyclohydrolase I